METYAIVTRTSWRPIFAPNIFINEIKWVNACNLVGVVPPKKWQDGSRPNKKAVHQNNNKQFSSVSACPAVVRTRRFAVDLSSVVEPGASSRTMKWLVSPAAHPVAVRPPSGQLSLPATPPEAVRPPSGQLSSAACAVSSLAVAFSLHDLTGDSTERWVTHEAFAERRGLKHTIVASDTFTSEKCEKRCPSRHDAAIHIVNDMPTGEHHEKKRYQSASPHCAPILPFKTSGINVCNVATTLTSVEANEVENSSKDKAFLATETTGSMNYGLSLAQEGCAKDDVVDDKLRSSFAGDAAFIKPAGLKSRFDTPELGAEKWTEQHGLYHCLARLPSNTSASERSQIKGPHPCYKVADATAHTQYRNPDALNDDVCERYRVPTYTSYRTVGNSITRDENNLLKHEHKGCEITSKGRGKPSKMITLNWPSAGIRATELYNELSFVNTPCSKTAGSSMLRGRPHSTNCDTRAWTAKREIDPLKTYLLTSPIKGNQGEENWYMRHR